MTGPSSCWLLFVVVVAAAAAAKFREEVEDRDLLANGFMGRFPAAFLLSTTADEED
jgi:hypothetical protein